MKLLSLFHLNRFLLPCQCYITNYIRKRRSNNILRKSVKWIITWFYKPYLLSISGAVWILLLCSKGITKQWVSVCKLRKSAVGLQMRSLIWKKTLHFFNFYFYICLHQMTFATFFFSNCIFNTICIYEHQNSCPLQPNITQMCVLYFDSFSCFNFC